MIIFKLLMKYNNNKKCLKGDLIIENSINMKINGCPKKENITYWKYFNIFLISLFIKKIVSIFIIIYRVIKILKYSVYESHS